MQDCSEMWIDSEPGVKQYFKEQNMAQLLASRQVEIIRVPVFKEKLTVTTSVYGMKPMFGFRNTYIYDAHPTTATAAARSLPRPSGPSSSSVRSVQDIT